MTEEQAQAAWLDWTATEPFKSLLRDFKSGEIQIETALYGAFLAGAVSHLFAPSLQVQSQ